MLQNAVWVVEAGGDIVAYIAFNNGWVSHLMTHPAHQGRGHGSRLLAHAMADGRQRQLWTFAGNARARRFYEAHGWALAERTGEDEPQVRYVSGAATT